jgi:ABC-type amino acid transport substrate-binding protein
VRSVVLGLLAICFSLAPCPLRAQETTAVSTQRKPMVVATKEAPPFSMWDAKTRTWSGISIDLWNIIANDPELNFQTEFHDSRRVKQLLDDVSSGRAQAGIAAITINEERENQVDFTFPYYNAGLAMAVVDQPTSAVSKKIWGVVKNGLMPLAIAVLVAGVVIWMLEFRCNSTHFGGGLLRGIGSGIWWAVVTVAAGYGDKYPTGCIGRFFGIIWMLGGMILLALFTGIVTTSLTLTSLEGIDIKPEELRKYRVGCILGTTADDYVTTHEQCTNIVHVTDVQDGLRQLKKKDIEVLVHDAPMLEYAIAEERKTDKDTPLKVLSQTFAPQSYSIALPEGSPYREKINRLLIRQTSDPAWQKRVQGILGK